MSPGLEEGGEGQEAEGGDEVLGLVPGHHSQGGSHQVLQRGQPLSRHLEAHIRAVNEPSRGFAVAPTAFFLLKAPTRAFQLRNS